VQPVSHAAQAVAPRVLKSREIADLSMTECIYSPGLRMPKHSHELAYFSLVLLGNFTETFGSGQVSGKPAVLIAHPPEHAHAVAFHSHEVRIFRTEIKSRWLERLRDSSIDFKSSSCFDGGLPVGLALRLYREFRAEDKYSTLAIEGLLLEMLAEVSRRREQSSRTRHAPLWLQRAREILHETALRVPALTEVAREVGVHPVHLAHEFRKFYGESVGEYARRLRLEAACRQISRTNLSLSEIAADAGFYDQSHFSNTFKRHTGMTPAEFRSAVRAH
jgi:AraC family transcriptional regulator